MHQVRRKFLKNELHDNRQLTEKHQTVAVCEAELTKQLSMRFEKCRYYHTELMKLVRKTLNALVMEKKKEGVVKDDDDDARIRVKKTEYYIEKIEGGFSKECELRAKILDILETNIFRTRDMYDWKRLEMKRALLVWAEKAYCESFEDD